MTQTMNRLTRMPPGRTRLTMICAVAFVTHIPAALAHDIWLTVNKQGDNATVDVNYGDVDKREMPDLRKIVSLELVGPEQTLNLRRPLEPNNASGKPALHTKSFAVPAGALLAVTYDNGFWIVNPDDKIESNSTKLLVASDKGSWWVPKFGKALLSPGAFTKLQHTPLEVVPVKDPYTLKVGDKLPVRIEHNGKPLADTDVKYCDGLQPIPDKQLPRVKTGSDGIAEIPLTRRGPYLLTAEYEGPGTRPDLADKDDMYASLTFDLTPTK